MAAVAVQRGVFAFQGEACFAVIQRFPVRLPANQLEIWAIVLAMAGHAVFAGRPWRHPNRVHASAVCDALAYLGVALHALEILVPEIEFVALGALQRPGQRLVRL